MRLSSLLLAPPLALLSLTAACGDDPGTDPEPDAMPPAAETVTFHASNTALLAIRDEGGAWRALTPDASGNAVAEVSGPYQVASVCDLEGFFDYYTISATPGDAEVLEVYCVEPAAATVEVTVDPAQVGQVFIGFSTLVAGDSTTVAPGTYDLVAIDESVEPPRVAIRRDVELTAATVVSFDLATEGVAMTAATVTVTGVGDDSTSGSSRLTTTNRTYARVPIDNGQAWLFPPALVEDGEHPRVSMTAYAGTPASRTGAVEVTGDESAISIALPAAITAATRTLGASPAVAWTSTEAWPERYFYLANADLTVFWDAMALPGYVDAMDSDATLTIPDPAALPGWQAAWNLAGAESLDWYLLLSRSLDDGYQSAGWDSVLAAERRAAVRPYLQARRVAASQR